MKYLNKSIYAFALVGMAGLWSCSQEDVLQGGDVTASGHPVPVTLTVNRGDAQTRTVLSENTATGGLNDVWEEGDKLHVYNSEGKEVGTLTITEGFDTPTGVFYGEVEAEQGEQELALWYYDDVESNPNLSFGRYSGNDVLVLDLKNQGFADVKALSKVDVLSKKVTLNVSGDKTTVVKDEVLRAYLSFARFSLAGLPDGTKGKLNIYDVSTKGTNSDGTYYNTYNTFKFKLNNASVAVRSSDKKDIVVSDVEAGKDVYVALVSSPTTEDGKDPSKGYQLGFKFTSTNGDVYTYEFENQTVLWAGKYYNSFLKNEGEETGTISGIEIPLVKEECVELRLNANFEGATVSEIIVTGEGSSYDLTKAYLANVDKESNKSLSVPTNGFTFVGWSKDATGNGAFEESASLTESATYYAIWAKNPLYKWAEGDLVYNKSTGTNSVASSYTTQGSLYQWGRNVGWSDYLDAMGTYEKLGSKTWYFATYGSKAYNSGTGLSQGSHQYDKSSTLINYKDMFFMDPNGTDYWVSSFGNGGSTWAERAKKCGWTGEAAPTGYRIAKISDFQEIYPNELSTYQTSSTLSSLLGHKEFKSYAGNESFKVAWRWTSEKNGSKYYLRIDARVVNSNFSDISKIDWTDKVSVETRYFGAHGAINAFVHTNVYEQLGNFPVARPMPFVEIHKDQRVIQTSGNTNYYTVVWQSIKDLSVNNIGYYWMADYKGGAFYFEDNSVAKSTQNYDGTYPFTSRKSMFSLSPVNPQNCCAIRCIHTDRE